MNVYLAGTMSRPYITNGRMEISLAGENGKTQILVGQLLNGGGQNYLAGEHPVKNGRFAVRGGYKILESYYYCRNNEWIPKLLPYLGDFLLDSGAFSFMSGAGAVDWVAYVNEYAAWINKYNIEKFLELDLDLVIGLKKTEELRDRLHQRVGRASIPVWHIARGQDYFLKMCEEYNYVAYGGLMSDGFSRQELEKSFPYFIREAHKRGAKIHGLGYTSIEGLHKYHFDSVDSTAWLYGNRGGFLYKFDPRRGDFDKIQAPAGHRLKSREAAMWNFNEWIKFQRYAEKYL